MRFSNVQDNGAKSEGGEGVGRILEGFCQILRFLLGALTAMLAVPVGMQVIARYTGVIPVYLWTEELATFIFVWVVMIGSMVAVWEGTHFDVRVTPDASRPLMIFLQQGIVLLLIGCFALLFAWYGLEYAKFGALQQSVMMQANKLVTFISVPISGAVWAIFAFYRLAEAFGIYQASRKVTP
jgi:TRAP-type C4-dicarboxylate transport system permease small subunit